MAVDSLRGGEFQFGRDRLQDRGLSNARGTNHQDIVAGFDMIQRRIVKPPETLVDIIVDGIRNQARKLELNRITFSFMDMVTCSKSLTVLANSS